MGWLFIFPLPLTLIFLKKDIKPAIKYGIIAIAWIVYLIIGFVGGYTEDAEEIDDSSSEVAIIYKDNECLNTYINNYNKANPDDTITSEEIEKDYHHGKVHDNQISILKENGTEIHVSESAVNSIQIYIKGNQVSTNDYKKLVFKYAKGIDPSLTNELLESYWKQILEDTTHTMEFDKINITINIFDGNIEHLTIDGELKK